MRIQFDGDMVAILTEMQGFLKSLQTGPGAPHSAAARVEPVAEEVREEAPATVSAEAPPAPRPGTWQAKPIADFRLSSRARNALEAEGFRTYGDVFSVTPEQVSEIRGVPRTAVETLRRAFKAAGAEHWGVEDAQVTPDPEPVPVEEPRATGAVDIFDTPPVGTNGAAEPKSNVELPSLEAVRSVLAEIARTDGLGSDAVRDLLNEFGVTKIQDLANQDRLHIVERANEQLEAST